MRAILVAVLLAPIAWAQEGREVEREGWTQFVPDWLEGSANITWQGRPARVEEGVLYATDGEHWLYGTRDTREELAEPPGCGPGDGGTYVMMSRTCTLVRHPSIGCYATDLCDRGIGQTPPAGPPPTVTIVGATPTYPLDTCGKVQYAKCTPALPIGVVIFLVGALALGSAALKMGNGGRDGI